MNMNYNQYLFSCLLKLFNSEFEQLEYDVQFGEAIREFELFENSEFNEDNKGLYECIVEYLTNKYGKR